MRCVCVCVCVCVRARVCVYACPFCMWRVPAVAHQSLDRFNSDTEVVVSSWYDERCTLADGASETVIMDNTCRQLLSSGMVYYYKGIEELTVCVCVCVCVCCVYVANAPMNLHVPPRSVCI